MVASGYRVSLHVKPAYARFVRVRALAGLARKVLAAEEVEEPNALSIVVTDDPTLRTLNRWYRGEDTPTDVLSFSLVANDGFLVPPEHLREIGEIVISYPTAARQARSAGHSTRDELAHLLVHGVLHLVGYDHEQPRETKAMRAREEALLGRAVH